MNRIIITVLTLVIVFFVGCEFGKYPLILDASVSGKTIRVDFDTPPPSYQISDSINIENLKDVTNESVDSLRFYNLTLLIDSTTTPNSTISGSFSVNGNTILTLNNVKVSDFLTERSIFDKNITGFDDQPAGILFLLQALRTQSPSVIVVSATLNPIANPIHIRLKIRLYAQVFANP